MPKGKTAIIFRLQSLTSGSFAALSAEILYNISIESPDTFLFGRLLVKSIVALLEYVMSDQSTPTYIHRTYVVGGCIFSFTTVHANF